MNQEVVILSSTWYIAKEYLKRLEFAFEEHGKKTFSLRASDATLDKSIEIFPGENWLTLTTKLMDIKDLSSSKKSLLSNKLLRANSTIAEISFGIDKNDIVVLRNVIPVSGISYDQFSSVYQAHLSGIKFFQDKLKPSLND